MATLADRILAWYDQNARKLPWREERDAYRIWVSEVMLQQTRVEAVREYYHKWMKRFPTAEALALASEQEVLTYWQGLGYYSRGQNLLQGVREVCSVYGGTVPENEPEIKSLPGIGEYTAGAILSIAYQKPVPAVDGNVLRIFSRLFCIGEDIMKQSVRKTITRLAQEHISAERPGDFNQALMDLGTMVCIPKRPRCERCPLCSLCRAYEQEVQDTLPVRSEKKKPLLVYLAAGIVERQGYYLLQQRVSGGLLADMWEFPTVEMADHQERTGEYWVNWFAAQWQQTVGASRQVCHKVHTFSHRKWDIVFYECTWLQGDQLPPRSAWIHYNDWHKLPWAGPHYKMAMELFKQLRNC